MKRREPRTLSTGKRFHKAIQNEWETTTRHGVPHPERGITKKNGRNGRIDIFVDGMSTMVSIIEIKNTDWDRIGLKGAKSYALKHARQIWDYVEAELDHHKHDVCPGVIYNRLPTNDAIRESVEDALRERGIQVVWHKETTVERKARSTNRPTRRCS